MAHLWVSNDVIFHLVRPCLCISMTIKSSPVSLSLSSALAQTKAASAWAASSHWRPVTCVEPWLAAATLWAAPASSVRPTEAAVRARQESWGARAASVSQSSTNSPALGAHVTILLAASSCSWGFHCICISSSSACNCQTTYKVCDQETGQCLCPPRTTGRQCEICVTNAWNWNGTLGCEVSLFYETFVMSARHQIVCHESSKLWKPSRPNLDSSPFRLATVTPLALRACSATPPLVPAHANQVWLEPSVTNAWIRIPDSLPLAANHAAVIQMVASHPSATRSRDSVSARSEAYFCCRV